jgi:hypothetical protein
VSQDSAALNASMASEHFIQYADLSRCFFITPTQVGNASIGGKSKKDAKGDFKVTFSPRPSGNEGPQCTFNLDLPHRDDVLAMHAFFSSLMQYHESVVTGGTFSPQLEPVTKGKHYQFSTTAYARPSNPSDGSLPAVLVYHFNIALLINGRPHHLGSVTLSGAINTVYNLRDDLEVLKALLQREPVETIRKLARPSAVWI